MSPGKMGSVVSSMLLVMIGSVLDVALEDLCSLSCGASPFVGGGERPRLPLR